MKVNSNQIDRKIQHMRKEMQLLEALSERLRNLIRYGENFDEMWLKDIYNEVEELKELSVQMIDVFYHIDDQLQDLYYNNINQAQELSDTFYQLFKK